MVVGNPNQVCFDCKAPAVDTDFGFDGKFHCVPCKLKQLGHAPRELTEEQCRERFLKAVWSYIDYWETESRATTSRKKLEGLTHSLLAMLDGCNPEVPAFIVAPIGDHSDADYHKKMGEDWWPTNADIQAQADMGGFLHDDFYKYRPEGSNGK